MRRLNDPVIVEAVRSPMGRGKEGGALSAIHSADLLAQVLQALMGRTGIDPGAVDDVLVGCVGQAGEQSGNVGRMAWLSAGYPAAVPAVTIERKCGSSQQALDFGVQAIASGAMEVVIVAGVESMSRVPMGSPRMDRDPYGLGVARRYEPGLVPQGISAELIAHKWGLSREDLDGFSLRSHQLAAKARDLGQFEREIVPIITPDGTTATFDETIRPDSSAEALAGLNPVFAREPWTERFNEIEFKVTAGNSSQITDGASAILVMDRPRAEAAGLRPRARVRASAVVGDDPMLMLTGPIPATRKVLERGELSIGDIDHFEVNEAFAAVPLVWQTELGISADKVNPRGGAIALGHPLGASGARLLTTMLHALESAGGKWGLQTMCEAGGMANATLVERLEG